MLFDNDDLRKGVLDMIARLGAKAVVVNDLEGVRRLSYRDSLIVNKDHFTMNQWFYCSWKVTDSESQQPSGLVANYMTPAVCSIERGLERYIRGRVASLLSTSMPFTSGLFTDEDYPAGHSREITLASNTDLRVQINQLVKIDRVIYSVIEAYEHDGAFKVILDEELHADLPKYTGVFAGPSEPQVTCGGVQVAVYFPPVVEVEPGQYSIDLIAGILVDTSRCELLNPAYV